MNSGKFIVDFLPGGVVRLTSPGGFSPALHMRAEEFLANVIKGLGGEVHQTKIGAVEHTHEHGHAHAHGAGGDHSHE